MLCLVRQPGIPEEGNDLNQNHSIIQRNEVEIEELDGRPDTQTARIHCPPVLFHSIDRFGEWKTFQKTKVYEDEGVEGRAGK